MIIYLVIEQVIQVFLFIYSVFRYKKGPMTLEMVFSKGSLSRGR